jgi:bacteriorhodopsin
LAQAILAQDISIYELRTRFGLEPAYCSIMGAPMSSFTVDKPEKAFLSETDFTAVSFWIISIAMIAATVFFYAESATVHRHWKTSLHVGGLVTLVAAVHYMYMREYWVAVGRSPIVYRYIDWSITVPLQMIEFNLILKAANAPISPAGFWKLLIGTVLMLAFGYAGESGAMNAWAGFALGMAGWGFILFEVFAGESAAAAGTSNVSAAVKQSYNNMRIIVSVGWAIYPAGYFLGQINNSAGAAQALNVTYNIADFVNKIAFVLACWSCAKADTEAAADKCESLLP